MKAPEPIPLAAPDGTVYCWACATCHHVSADACLLIEHGPEEIAGLAESFREDAAQCCRCQKCGGVAPSYSADRPIADLSRGICGACWEGGERARHEAHMAEVNAQWAAADARREESKARSRDPLAADALETLMSNISEENYCAGWLCDLEYILWGFVTTEPLAPQSFGMGTVSLDEQRELRELSGRAGGWWRHREFVPMDEWVADYKANASEHQEPD